MRVVTIKNFGRQLSFATHSENYLYMLCYWTRVFQWISYLLFRLGSIWVYPTDSPIWAFFRCGRKEFLDFFLFRTNAYSRAQLGWSLDVNQGQGSVKPFQPTIQSKFFLFVSLDALNYNSIFVFIS